jgi:hypothetical protein
LLDLLAASGDGGKALVSLMAIRLFGESSDGQGRGANQQLLR